VLAIYFYYQSKREKILVYSKQTFNLVKSSLSKIENIEIKYNDSVVKNLSLTKFAIWNAGKDPIKRVDIASTDPLIVFANNDIIIYDYKISNQNDVNNIQIKRIDSNAINISFEYLGFNDGLVLNIYHNSQSSIDIKIKGTIIGAKNIKYGIKKNYFSEKIDFTFKPLNYFLGHKNIMVKILGGILTFPIALIGVPLAFIILPLDYFIDRVINKNPKEFYFHDD
jgi:hypothetical protein